MYLPAHFRQPDQATIHRLMLESPLATLVNLREGEIEANHLPMLPVFDGDAITLRFHVARANPVWRDVGGGDLRGENAAGDVEALAIFQGPDTYVSPSWYASKAEDGKVVPTWNYVVVHAYGRLSAFDDKEWLRAFLPEFTDRHEARFEKSWKVSDAPPDYLDQRMQAIVGMELSVTRLMAKWKVSQNQSAVNRASLVSGLDGCDQPGARAIAQVLAEQAARRSSS